MRKQPLIMVCVAALLPGCDSAGTGTAIVRWNVGLTGSCTTAGLERVEVRLQADDGTTVASRDAPCWRTYVRFDSVPARAYRAIASATDRDGIAAYSGSADIVVREGWEPDSSLVILGPTPGELDVEWYFEGGRLCIAYGVEDVAVHLFLGDSDVVARSAACDAGTMRFDDLEPDSYDILVVGVDAAGNASYSSVLPRVLVRPGRNVTASAVLAACDGECL